MDEETSGHDSVLDLTAVWRAWVAFQEIPWGHNAHVIRDFVSGCGPSREERGTHSLHLHALTSIFLHPYSLQISSRYAPDRGWKTASLARPLYIQPSGLYCSLWTSRSSTQEEHPRRTLRRRKNRTLVILSRLARTDEPGNGRNCP
jgi:hypothetical protein